MKWDMFRRVFQCAMWTPLSLQQDDLCVCVCVCCLPLNLEEKVKWLWFYIVLSGWKVVKADFQSGLSVCLCLCLWHICMCVDVDRPK